MDYEWSTIIFFLLVIDSLGAVIMSWVGREWWLHQKTGVLGKWFPPAKGWSLLYFILVLTIGNLLGII